MGMSLKAKLAAMANGAPAPAPPSSVGLFEYVHREDAPEALFHLTGAGLEMMDFHGSFDPRGALFLDTETTGLRGGAGTVAFLVGLGRIEGRQFTVYQYMLPDYGAEPLLLQKVAALARDAACLVTFNGRSFDVPLLKSRYVMCRMADPLEGLEHLDLIHPARRAWKLRLKDCSLGHIESSVLGVTRQGDLPGGEVPERFFQYIKTGDRSLLDDIVAHNRQDIMSLGTLLVRLHDAYAAPARQTSMLDVFSLGMAIEKRGGKETAKACYRLAARERPLSTIERLRERRVAAYANRQLSLMFRREGSGEASEAVWREMIERGQMGIFPYVELAKYLEHQKKDIAAALSLTEKALAIAGEKDRPALIKRRERLLSRRVGKIND